MELSKLQDLLFLEFKNYTFHEIRKRNAWHNHLCLFLTFNPAKLTENAICGIIIKKGVGDLTDLFDKIIASIQGLGTDQLVALMFGIMAFGVAKKVVREGISLIMSVVGILFCLYFVAPDLYYQLFEVLRDLFYAVEPIK